MKHVLIALAAMVAALAPAEAQEGLKIFHFNQQAILQDASAAADANRKLQDIIKTLQEELKTGEEKLQAAQTELETQQAVVNEEKAAELRRAFNDQLIDFAVEQQVAELEAERARQTAFGQIRASITNILNSLAAERKADFVFETSSVVFASPKYDVTQEVLSRLNAATPSVNVERVPLTDKEREQVRVRLLQQLAAQAQQAG